VLFVKQSTRDTPLDKGVRHVRAGAIGTERLPIKH
jgi:hypothetical protein